MKTKFDKKTFSISRRDAERICEGLDFASTWDKTDIYYNLMNWLREEKDKKKDRI